jgi:hypothetical protein
LTRQAGSEGGYYLPVTPKHFTATVEADGTVRLPQDAFPPGTEVELYVLPSHEHSDGEDMPEGIATFLLAHSVLRREWDNPEEDEAWRDL